MSVRVGFIGTGGISRTHLNNLKDFPDVELVAMCDVQQERAESAAKQYGGKVYTDYKKMFDSEKLDALYICLPPFAHTDQEIRTTQLKIPFFVEKPIAVTMEKALEINEAVQKSGVITSVGYNWRYMDITDTAKRILSGKKVLGALGYWMGGLPGTPWWRVRAQSGGQHVEQTTHIFDICRYLIGSTGKIVHAVAASGSMTDVPNYDVDDMSLVNIQFKNGAAANIASACCLSQGYKVEIDVICRDLVLEIGGGSLRMSKRGEIEGRVVETQNSRINPYQLEDRTFIDAVTSKDGSKIRAPYGDALETQRIMMAASESLKTGKAVEI